MVNDPECIEGNHEAIRNDIVKSIDDRLGARRRQQIFPRSKRAIQLVDNSDRVRGQDIAVIIDVKWKFPVVPWEGVGIDVQSDLKLGGALRSARIDRRYEDHERRSSILRHRLIGSQPQFTTNHFKTIVVNRECMRVVGFRIAGGEVADNNPGNILFQVIVAERDVVSRLVDVGHTDGERLVDKQPTRIRCER